MYKIKYRAAYMTIFVFFFMQIAIGPFFASIAIIPNLMIIVTIFFALFTDGKFGLKAGLLSGLLLDIFSVRLFGVNTALFAFCGYLIGRFSSKFYKESVITHIIITFAASFFILIAYFLCLSLRNPLHIQQLGYNIFFNNFILASSIINSFFGAFIFAFLCMIFRLGEAGL